MPLDVVLLVTWLAWIVFLAGLCTGRAFARGGVRKHVLLLIAQRDGMWFNALRDVYIRHGGTPVDISPRDH